MNQPTSLKRAIQLHAALALAVLSPLVLQADVVVLQNGAVITGHILQQDSNGVLLRMEYGTFRYPAAAIKEAKPEAATVPHVSNNGRAIPDWAQIITLLAKNRWATEIQQVPATVINYGSFNRVPYVSFRCAAGGYEINIFGDLDKPAAVQIGAMSYLKDSAEAKTNCVNFICSVLADAGDRQLIRSLNLNQPDAQKNARLSVETLMPGDWGSYGGWMLTVYDPAALAAARASDADLLALTQPGAAPTQPATASASAASSTSPAAGAEAQQPSDTTTQPTTTTYDYGYGGYYDWTAAERAAARPGTPVASSAVAAANRPADTTGQVYPRSYTRTDGAYGRRR